MKFPYEKQFLVCTGARCNDDKHGDDAGLPIREELKHLNKKLGRKSTVRVCSVSCLDLCEQGPNIVVWPEGEVYTGQDRKSAVRLYHAVMDGNEQIKNEK